MKTLLALLIVLAALPVSAQDFAAADCDQAALLGSLATQLAQIKPGDDFWAAYADLQTVIASEYFRCAGLTLEGDGSQPQAVLGPLDIPDGVYRVTLTTSGRLKLELEELDGDCRYTGFVVSEGEAVQGVQDRFEAEGCRLTVSIDHADRPWTLVFEPLS